MGVRFRGLGWIAPLYRCYLYRCYGTLSRVSPRTADPALRTALIEAAAHLIATEGLSGLSLRRLAAEVHTSTMSIYTHFGSMDEVRRAVRLEAFARFGAHLAAVAETADPVADLALLGQAYYLNAVTNPDLYRAMFMEPCIDPDDAAIGLETFEVLVAAVDRCIRAARFAEGDRVAMARQLWVMQHGAVTLHLVGLLSAEDTVRTLSDMGANLLVAFGDEQVGVAAAAKGASGPRTGRS